MEMNTKGTLADTVKALQEHCGASVTATTVFRGEHTVTVTKEGLYAALKFSRDELGFDFLIDITTVDHMGQDPRFEVNYHLYGHIINQSLRIKSFTPEDEANFPTVVPLWSAANWHEREAWDMMGIKFIGHPDLRRILMWEGYPFFPLRKEFPLAGKESEMPDVAFSNVAPLQGGPFITSPGAATTVTREPRAKSD
jgi:NADH-quinone oxidoreductase subunit C